MTEHSTGNVNGAEDQAPLALLFYTDLMFGVQLQKMAQRAGYRHLNLRPGQNVPPASVLIVDLAARADWETVVRNAVQRGIKVIAFGPHMDSEARRHAKAAGASRVLANSNLTRDLPTILLTLAPQSSLSAGEVDAQY